MNKKLAATIEKMPQTGFHFNNEAHVYVLDGKPLTGVTTILSVIAKPALIQWSADMACKYVKENLGDIAQLEMVLAEARLAHRKKKESAGKTGTDVHVLIETYVKFVIEHHEGHVIPGEPSDNAQVQKFINWAIDNDITFLESEKRLFSKEHWYAGTVDLVFLKDGKKHIGDIKTSSGIYGREFFFQMAGYQIALEENGEKDIFANTIIRCGKDGSFEVQDSFDTESDKAGFLAALKLYRELNK